MSRARFTYLYDFGDGWSHTVKLDRLETLPADVDPTFLASAIGACLPEDCGGPFGYADLLDAYADPTHEDHRDAIDILGKGFDPNVDPTIERQKAIDQLITRWAKLSRKPR